MTPLDQRVEQFEKTARYMMKKLDQTLQQIKVSEGSNVEHMKHLIAPDAALILSQGDTLILETHGKDCDMTKRLLKIQNQLRDKYKDVQNCNTSNVNLLEKRSELNSENYFSPQEKVFSDKKFLQDFMQLPSSRSAVNLEDLVSKVLKRVNDLISKPLDLSSEDEITKRILDVGVSFKRQYFKLS